MGIRVEFVGISLWNGSEGSERPIWQKTTPGEKNSQERGRRKKNPPEKTQWARKRPLERSSRPKKRELPELSRAKECSFRRD